METTRDQQVKPTSIHNWKTSDEDEIARRRHRARTESLQVPLKNYYVLHTRFSGATTSQRFTPMRLTPLRRAAPTVIALRALTGECYGKQTIS